MKYEYADLSWRAASFVSHVEHLNQLGAEGWLLIGPIQESRLTLFSDPDMRNTYSGLFARVK